MSVVNKLLEQAQSSLRSNDLAAAHVLCGKVLDRQAENAAAWQLLGAICLQLRQLDAGRSALIRAAALDPGNGVILADLAKLEEAAERLPQAIDRYRQALDLAPDRHDVWMRLAEACRKLGRHQEALAAYRRVVNLMPDNVNALIRIAEVTQGRLDFAEAESAARRACTLAPDHVLPYLALSNALVAQGKYEEVFQALQRALQLEPDSPLLLTQMARVFEHWREPLRAVAYYRRLLDVDPGNGWAFGRMVDAKLASCDWAGFDDFAAGLAEQIEVAMLEGREVTADLINLLPLPFDPDFMTRVACYKAAWFARQSRGRLPDRGTASPAQRDRRIRIGYLLPYTVRHSMPTALMPVIQQHDRGRFEIFGYSLTACDNSEGSLALRNAFDAFADLIKQKPEHAAQRIHADNIDILVDTTGHTNINWLPVLAFRPAPIQVHYLGYSLTTGADYVDYLISDRNFIPEAMRNQCSESLVYLPDSFMATARAPIDPERPRRSELGLPESGIVFANFNQPAKFEPVMFATWMRILRQVPGSVMWLGEWNRNAGPELRRQAADQGVDSGRLIFSPMCDHAKHLARLQLADLALDNRLHGGGVTSVDALWAGLPVLSVAGASPAARLGASLNSAAGIPELVVEDLRQYERTAVSLARAPERLRSIRSSLERARTTSPLFDQGRYRRHLELAYEMIWQRHCDGEPPGQIEVPALA